MLIPSVPSNLVITILLSKPNPFTIKPLMIISKVFKKNVFFNLSNLNILSPILFYVHIVIYMGKKFF